MHLDVNQNRLSKDSLFVLVGGERVLWIEQVKDHGRNHQVLWHGGDGELKDLCT